MQGEHLIGRTAALAEKLGFDVPDYRWPYEQWRTNYPIGQIGLHWVVQCMYLPAYRAARYNLAGAAEINEDRIAEAVAKGMDPANITRDWKELVRRPNIAVLDCCFGHRGDKLQRRLEVIAEAAAHGKHVLIQKPVAHSVKVAAEMAAVAEKGKIWLAVNQNCRYNPANFTVRQLLGPDRLGPARIIELQQYWGSGAVPSTKGHAVATIDHAIHHADLIRWWAGSPCVSVYARARQGSTLAIYEFENGSIAYHMEAHSGVRAHENEVRITTDRGTIKAGHNWGWHTASSAPWDFVEVFRGNAERSGIAIPLPEHIYEPAWHGVNPWEKREGGPDAPYFDLAAPTAGMMGTMGALMRAVETRQRPDNHISTAIEAMRMCLSAQLSAQMGKPVDPRELPQDFEAIV
jgi:predicted dehydrogenase